MSHLLEHMLFKGTTTRSTNAIAQAVQDEGGYINAYTSFDRTVYWIDVPRAGAATAIELLADACMNSTLPADEFVKEQEVIRREFAMLADDPDRVNSHQLFSTAYREHAYKHPVIGHLDVFNQLTRDDVMAYYKARYVPNNLTFVVVGDVDAGEVLAQLETLFAPHPRRALPPVFLPEEPPQLGRREAHREFPTELSRVLVSWHIPCITHPDVPALDVLATALGEGRSSRLYRIVREEKQAGPFPVGVLVRAGATGAFRRGCDHRSRTSARPRWRRRWRSSPKSSATASRRRNWTRPSASSSATSSAPW